jgi:hypothetical protein
MRNRKKHLLEQMVTRPLQFNNSMLKELVQLKGDNELQFTDLRNNLLRIYDMNEASLQEASNPMLGSLGWFNKKSTEGRQKKYFKRIRNHIAKNSNHRIIVAEGDSWFQFPFFITDIIDWLLKDKNFALYSIAAGGDWLANIIYEGKYIEELSVHNPHVFLISGGGNDFIGGNRIAIMVSKNQNRLKYHSPNQIMEAAENTITQLEANTFYEIQQYINPEFYAYMWTLKTQYYMLFRNLSASKKFSNLKIVTQGYDHVIPSSRYRWNWRYPHQYIINWFVNTGQWLKQPLQIKGINDGNQQRWIMRYLIFEVNQMFSSLATEKDVTGQYLFPHVYHIDCRNVARDYHDWFDEIHLKSNRYKVIAKAYSHVINETENFDPGKKVIKAVDFDR